MSTHIGKCVVCDKTTYCCNDEHVLGAGRGIPCSPKEGFPPIEFCSLECFMELRNSMENRLRIAREIYPEWFSEVKNA